MFENDPEKRGLAVMISKNNRCGQIAIGVSDSFAGCVPGSEAAMRKVEILETKGSWIWRIEKHCQAQAPKLE